jgi:hypothetical protein
VAPVDGRGEGLGGVHLRAVDAATALRAAERRGLPVEGNRITVGGVRFALV